MPIEFPQWWTRQRPADGIRDALAAAAAGDGRSLELARLNETRPRDVANCLAEMLPCVTGQARERLSRLAVELGIVECWQEQARSGTADIRKKAITRLADLDWGVSDSVLMMALADDDESMRAEAGRALLRSGGRHDVEHVFGLAVSDKPPVRPELAAQLGRYALELSEFAIPNALRSEDPGRIAGALRLICGWAKALPLADLPPLLGHQRADIRALALGAVPYAMNVRSLDSGVVRALCDPSDRVRAAACAAAARLRLEAALPGIVECLRAGSAALARKALHALAEFGQLGLLALEREIRAASDPSEAGEIPEDASRAREGS